MPETAWRSWGYLPHFDKVGTVQSITIRLADAMPQEILKRWTQEVRHLPDEVRDIEQRKRIEAYLDAGYGECWLRDTRIADLVETALLHLDGERYRLYCWCVMPNHVHFVLETMEGWTLGSIIHALKSYTSHETNKMIGRSGALWQREYHDRFIRDGAHFQNVMRYIEMNPVKAKLASHLQDWLWCSSRLRESGHELPIPQIDMDWH